MKILIATGNLNKVREIKALLTALDIEVLTLKDFPSLVMPEETGKTFKENAILKAKSACAQSGLITLADDSGLEVDALGGAPGVYSARYAGENCSYTDNNKKLLTALKNIPSQDRGAQFTCVMAICFPSGKIITEAGIMRGEIVKSLHGTNGFGYDPLFKPKGFSETFAELTSGKKNSISHRFLAIEKITPHLKNISAA